ncbi:hypothetical protein [Alkalibacterium sp. 20]|uniref:hypothetical protein n=1 Tax=Alkalibacterium sp. 20 TaxID=1798803 RepID=UPI00090020B3|nr:hypothetical protein [Alkalibacterium sp. 20]OJF95340.1 hypothetical protein AX762_06745 [Alkalibacterium sp. 20]
MNKRKLIVLFLAATTLAACTTDDGAGETETLDPIEEEAAIEEEPGEALVTDEEMAPISDEELEQAEVIDDLDQYPEFAEQDAFDPTVYDAYLITDNGSTRVILFQDGDEQVFKSVYIEEDNRLKIIDLQNNELLINSPL